MKIVVCHNYFRERGGEDKVYEEELSLLRDGGHDVIQLSRHNNNIKRSSVLAKALSAPWNQSVFLELKKVVKKIGAEVVHIHNTLPQLSPAVFHAARSAGAAVVHTLHNYRWACPSGILFRDGKPCEECLGRKVPWPAVRHGCYRDSHLASSVIAATLSLHNFLGTPRMADAYIVAGSFTKDKLIEAGLPSDRMYIRPNFLNPDPGIGTGSGDFAMYLGRLSSEKRVDTLIEAWSKLDGAIPLKISGDGPLRQMVRDAARRIPNIEYLGFAPRQDVDRLLGEARALIFTSGTYEVQPISILETFARGTPVIAGRIGAMQGMIEDGVTGWLFEPGDSGDLARIVGHAFDDPKTLASMRDSVRREFLNKYSIAGKMESLIGIYSKAIERMRSIKENTR